MVITFFSKNSVFSALFQNSGVGMQVSELRARFPKQTNVPWTFLKLVLLLDPDPLGFLV